MLHGTAVSISMCVALLIKCVGVCFAFGMLCFGGSLGFRYAQPHMPVSRKKARATQKLGQEHISASYAPAVNCEFYLAIPLFMRVSEFTPPVKKV